MITIINVTVCVCLSVRVYVCTCTCTFVRMLHIRDYVHATNAAACVTARACNTTKYTLAVPSRRYTDKP